MKIQKTIFVNLLLLFTVSSFAQEFVVKKLTKSDLSLSQDVILKRALVSVDEKKAYKTFEVEVSENGLYYMNSWLMGGEKDSIGSGKFVDYEVSVNGSLQKSKTKPLKSNWHNSPYNNNDKEKKAIKLKKGINQIHFSCDLPDIPQIEFIKLSLKKEKSEIQGTEYKEFVEKAKKSTPALDKKALNNKLKSYEFETPLADYYHSIDLDFKYTWYKSVYHKAGETLKVRVWSDVAVMIDVFNQTYPESYSWSKYGEDDDEAKLTITIPVTGFYYVKVRTWRQNITETASIDLNNTY